MPDTQDALIAELCARVEANDQPAAIRRVNDHLDQGGSIADVMRLFDAKQPPDKIAGYFYFLVALSVLFRDQYDFRETLDRCAFDFSLTHFSRAFCADEYRAEFSRPYWRFVNKALYVASLSHMGVGYFSPSGDETGEAHMLRGILTSAKPVVLDVGGNVGGYAAMVRSLSASAEIYSFEPNPVTYESLAAAARKHGFSAYCFGLSDAEGTATLYDRADSPQGSGHASLYEAVLTSLHKTACVPVTCAFRTLDQVVEELGITHIDLLKIDTEGHEMAVLRGGEKTLARGAVDHVHFEFNEMNVISRSFMRDFMQTLPGHAFYRVLPEGLLPLGREDSPLFNELFGYQNILASKDAALQ